MTYTLFIDDEREPRMPFEGELIVVARSSNEAIELIKSNGWPGRLLLDHDLSLDANGQPDTTMIFLKRLVNEVWDGETPPPAYTVHSMNPQGKANIISFMESWKKSL